LMYGRLCRDKMCEHLIKNQLFVLTAYRMTLRVLGFQLDAELQTVTA
jgi:hypothetical protein